MKVPSLPFLDRTTNKKGKCPQIYNAASRAPRKRFQHAVNISVQPNMPPGAKSSLNGRDSRQTLGWHDWFEELFVEHRQTDLCKTLKSQLPIYLHEDTEMSKSLFWYVLLLTNFRFLRALYHSVFSLYIALLAVENVKGGVSG